MAQSFAKVGCSVASLLTDDELIDLRRYVLMAVNGTCIPEWEFEALVGCTRIDARGLLASALSAEGELEDILDYLVALLSALSGSAQLVPSARRSSHASSPDLATLHALLSKLLGSDPQPERCSAVTLRGSARPIRVRATRIAKKRRAETAL